MSKSRLPILLGVGAASGVGYYLFQAGGDPRAAENKFESESRRQPPSDQSAPPNMRVLTMFLQATPTEQPPMSRATCPAAHKPTPRRTSRAMARRLEPRLTMLCVLTPPSPNPCRPV
ncbi:hypothetical protein AUP68_01877 [Ilyonectria robusta]